MKASPSKSDDHLEKLGAKIPCALTTHQPDEDLSGEVELRVGLQAAALLNFLGTSVGTSANPNPQLNPVAEKHRNA